MNIEIANRLVQLRKEKSLSQEALAQELGISRQAVSKWERAEASPDTDNLILLANLYGMSLDDLLRTNQEKFESEEPTDDTSKNSDENEEEDDNTGDYVHVSLSKGVHVKEKNGDEVHVGWDGIHVIDRSDKKSEFKLGKHGIHMSEGIDGGDEFKLDKSGVYINGKVYNKEDWKEFRDGYRYDFPIGVIVTVAYLFIGFAYGAWHPGWLIFGIIPLFHSLVSAVRHRDIIRFAYPVLIIMIVGYYGFIVGTWYPTWLLVLTIPLFYSLFGYMKHLRKKNKY